MADELFDGNIASEMTLGEAIVRGILNPPKYVTALFAYKEQYNRLERKIRNSGRIVYDKCEAQLEALRRRLENSIGLDEIFKKHLTEKDGKYIVFCSSKEHMDEMISHVPEWFGAIDPQPNIYRAYTGDPSTSKAFSKFKEDNSEHLKLLFCIDMLNEGIHVEDVCGVILFRPTVSPIVFKQQIGRAMSASGKKDAVILDIVDNISNLYSISAIQEEMQTAIDTFRFYEDDASIVNPTFNVIDELQDCRKLFDALENTLYSNWDLMYLEAKRYYEQHGDLLPDNAYTTEEGYRLGQWIVTQRTNRRKGSKCPLSEEQIKKLDEIGMNWLTRLERFWEAKFELAKQYYEKNGNLRVSAKARQNDNLMKSLSTWISTQRGQYYRRTLREDYYKRLSEIGMVWEIQDNWLDGYESAKRFYEENGHLDIPAAYVSEDGVLLGIWYRHTRDMYRRNTLSEDRIRMLEAIGIQWESILVRKWNSYYELARQYYEEHGDLNVHLRYSTKDGTNLGIWVSSQRENYKKKRLSADQIEKLEAIGISWERFTNKWNLAYGYAKLYYDQHGNITVPVDYETEDGFKLGAWIAAQRTKLKKGKLTEHRIKLLDELGMAWVKKDSFWQHNYELAVLYYKANNNLNVPAKYLAADGTKLGAWIANQRIRYKSGALTAEQIEMLEEIGIVWDRISTLWENGFNHAKDYFIKNGNLLVKRGEVTEDGFTIGNWVNSQRRNYKSNKLTQEQIEMLEGIGMIWDVLSRQWEIGFSYAKCYYEKHGDFGLPNSYVAEDGFKLGEWKVSQKRAVREGTISAERLEKLRAIGFDYALDKV